MNVTEAVARRRSIRAFLDRPVPEAKIAELLEKAARAPSGGNLQPWRVFVVHGAALERLQKHLQRPREREAPEYAVYPKDLKSPYRDSRFKVGEDMYALLNIPREDKAARFAHLARNYQFFDAPVGLFCFVDRQMGPPQWSDLGMFLQTFMLLAAEAGLDTCAQEAWAMRAASVAEFFESDPDWMLFCGMALGYRDPNAAVNELQSDREPLQKWATFVAD
ncbi:MAG: nitroreductase [Pseudomonadales bacterium]